MNDNHIPAQKVIAFYNALVEPDKQVKRLSTKRIESLHLREHLKSMVEAISSSSLPQVDRRKKRLNRAARIKVLAKENPKRPGTQRYEVFNLYRDGMSVDELLQTANDRRTALRALRHDLEDGFIRLAGVRR